MKMHCTFETVGLGIYSKFKRERKVCQLRTPLPISMYEFIGDKIATKLK